jgi:hypothetical protein
MIFYKLTIVSKGLIKKKQVYEDASKLYKKKLYEQLNQICLSNFFLCRSFIFYLVTFEFIYYGIHCKRKLCQK